MIGLNIGSGQRRFDTEAGWINIDCVSRPPDQVPDLICDVGRESLPYRDESVDYVVLHQVYEHFGCGEGHGIIREARRVLKLEGSLIVTVPDTTALINRWALGQISDYIFNVNMYGAFQGEEGDRHRWSYTYKTLRADLENVTTWSLVRRFGWYPIPGADIAKDWWILGIEAVK